MLFILLLSSFISSAFTADAEIDQIRCFNDNARYFYFPGDGTNQYHLVDTQETTNVSDIKFRSDTPSKTKYWLYTRLNPTTQQVLVYSNKSSITNSNLDAKKTTVFLAHGWLGNGTNLMSTSLTEAFLQDKDVNVIVVDWSYWASKSYFVAMHAVMTVGRDIGKFAIGLEPFGVSLDNIHLVGFSLGAHVVGCAGRSTGSKVRRITALDPAGPLWYRNKFRLVKTDAQYVEVIHTNTIMFGYSKLCGSSDFFPNGGKFMPECDDPICSHESAFKYMVQSLKFKNMTARECSSYENAILVEDVCFGTAYRMGDNDLSHIRSGIFRVDTKPPNKKMLIGNHCF